MALLASGQILPAAGNNGTLFGLVDNDQYLRLLTRSASYGAIYRSQPWVAALVNKLAFSTARLPLIVYEKNGSDRQRAPGHPYAELLANPNHEHDAFYLWLWTVSTYEVYGEAIWVKKRRRRGQPPTEIWPLHPANTSVKLGDDGRLQYHWLEQDIVYAQEDVVHFRSYNPDEKWRGLSRLEPLRDSLVSEEAVREAQEAIWRNGARPTVVIEHPREMGAAAHERLRSSWNALYSGVENWGKSPILEEGAQAKVLQLTAADMEVTEQRKLSREEACAVYDVPPPVIHILDHATFSNITEQMRSMYRDTMAPRLRLFESVLNKQLRPDFDVSGDVYAEFLLDEVLRGDFEQRVEAYQKGVTSGWLKPSEVRRLENLPDAGVEADRLFVNSALVPMSSQPTTPRTTPAPTAQRALEPGRALTPEAWEHLTRTLFGRLGRLETFSFDDLPNLTEGLPDFLRSEIAGRLLLAGHPADVSEVRGIVRGVLEDYR